jgi:hypothetical protein
MMRKRLSTSVYTFSKIIKENGMYVDKTKELYQLVSKLNGQIFLARPRRFGKSLTLSTLESFFNGERELFKGLYLYDRDIAWKKHPVVRLALNQMSSRTAAELEKKLCWSLDFFAKNEKIKLTADDAASKLGELIRELSLRGEKVVVLIDEYDKPILDNILNTEEVQKIRTLLKGFYGIIKACEEYLRFTFITGVSKFTQVSVFSDLNNLDDISMNDDYASLCGFTQEECEHYFAEWIEENSQTHNMTKEAYLEKIKQLYDGIRFSRSEVRVYNPVSFTRAMDDKRFDHYWFETGTPSFLLKLLKQKEYPVTNLEKLEVKSSDFSSYDIDRLRVEPLLYQTGYLTIKEYDEHTGIYTLSYPNKEVRQSFVEYLTDFFTPVSRVDSTSLLARFMRAVQNSDIEEMFDVLNAFYRKIDYDIKLKHEKYYQTIFYIFYTLLGYMVKVEVHTHKGRMDAVVFSDSDIYIFEFKLDKTPDVALKQIMEREYYQKYVDDKRNLTLFGVSFTSETGEIKEWKMESIERSV